MSYMKTNEKLHGLKKSEDKWLCSMMWAIGFVLFVMLLSAFLIFKCINVTTQHPYRKLLVNKV